jgi:hypothetical protein
LANTNVSEKGVVSIFRVEVNRGGLYVGYIGKVERSGKGNQTDKSQVQAKDSRYSLVKVFLFYFMG